MNGNVAVTGALSATGAISTSGNTTNNWGAGGTSSSQTSLNLNGGSAAGGGPLLTGSNNSVSKWIIASSGAIFADTSTHLLLRSNSDNVYVQAAGATIGIFSTTGLAVTGALSCTGALAIGNTVNTVSPTSPNRTVTIVIGGTTYYLAAKTTND